MSAAADSRWWTRVRGKNRTVTGYISGRRRLVARRDRLAGRKPDKREFSGGAIARRIKCELPALKRVLRGQAAPWRGFFKALAADLQMPAPVLAAAWAAQFPGGSDAAITERLALARLDARPDALGYRWARAQPTGDPLARFEAAATAALRSFFASPIRSRRGSRRAA